MRSSKQVCGHEAGNESPSQHPAASKLPRRFAHVVAAPSAAITVHHIPTFPCCGDFFSEGPSRAHPHGALCSRAAFDTVVFVRSRSVTVTVRLSAWSVTACPSASRRRTDLGCPLRRCQPGWSPRGQPRYGFQDLRGTIWGRMHTTDHPMMTMKMMGPAYPYCSQYMT